MLRPSDVAVSSLLISISSCLAAVLHGQPKHQLQQDSQQMVLGSASGHPSTHNQKQLYSTLPWLPNGNLSGFIALGDSYSAGIGTGLFNGTEDDCRHGVHAYPMLILGDFASKSDSDTPSFQFLSCTGSTIQDMLAGAEHSQIDQLNTSIAADFAMLSIGGNDLGFFEIMNSCVFRFYNFFSGTCETALRNANEQLNSPRFENELRLVIIEILDRLRWEMHPSFTITITGYARFFNAETRDCDDYSLGMWWRGPKLTRDLRRKMNEIVLAVNDKIRRSVDAINTAFANPRLLFVDYDDAFEGHRFCEPGVVEPDYLRNDTWFFLVGGMDNDDSADAQSLSESKSRHAVPLPPMSPLVNTQTCYETSQRSGDWGEQALCMMAISASQDPYLRTADGQDFSKNSMWYVPTYYGKTFHPRTLGHTAIRDRVYQKWQEFAAQKRSIAP